MALPGTWDTQISASLPALSHQASECLTWMDVALAVRVTLETHRPPTQPAWLTPDCCFALQLLQGTDSEDEISISSCFPVLLWTLAPVLQEAVSGSLALLTHFLSDFLVDGFG